MSHPPSPVAEALKTPVRILRRSDPFFCQKWTCSPYRGCAHACTYCDGRAEKYNVEGNFETDIRYRPDLPSSLAEFLPHRRERGYLHIGSGVTDAYQPLESDLGLTRECLRTVSAHDVGVGIVTKSSLILRDMDLLEAIARRGGAIVMVTLTTSDENLRSIVEPGASPVGDRLEVLRECSRRGIPAGALFMPILPGLMDSDESVESHIGEIKASGAQFIIPGFLTLRPGRQKDCYMTMLREMNPGLVPLYRELYAEERPSGSPITPWRKAAMARVTAHLQRAGMPGFVPHSVFHGRMDMVDEIDILLSHMEYVYAGKGIDVSSLRSAAARYGAWLDEIRTRFNRRKNLPPGYPDEVFTELLSSGNESSLFGNERLSRFVKDIVLEDCIWNPVTLKLEKKAAG